MRKSPEEYFKAQDFSLNRDEKNSFTPAEQAFMTKYMGMDSAAVLEQLGIKTLAPEAKDQAATQALVVEFCEQPTQEAAQIPGSAGDSPFPAVGMRPLEEDVSDAADPLEGSAEAGESSLREDPSGQEESMPPAHAPAALPSERDYDVGEEPGEDTPLPAGIDGETQAMPVEKEAVALAGKSRSGSPAMNLFGESEAEYEPEEASLEEMLKHEQEIQMVGFFIGEQEFTIPTAAVQEVIRYMPVAKLPAAPSFVAGVINLRGRVTPLVELRDILEVRSPRKEQDKFIIICRRQGLQIGMLIEKVHTMYRVPQADIEWGIETHLGINGECIAGLFKQNEQLVSIVSVDRVIADVLK